MKIAFGADHAGFELKEHVKSALIEAGHEAIDCGAVVFDPDDDYPQFCAAAARKVSSGEAERAIVIGKSGQGEQIVANKVHGIRAALCNDAELARLSREHNDANVLAIGSAFVSADLADEIVELWLKTEFEGGRHERRVEQITLIEGEERQ